MARVISSRVTYTATSGRRSLLTISPLHIRLSLWVIFFTIILGMTFLHVWIRTQSIELGYKISRVAEEQKSIIQRNREFKIEVATLKSPARIEHIATKYLGLTIPRREEVIVIK